MLGLDVRSVILIAGIMSLLMAVVLFFLRRSYPPSIKGLREWAAAPVILFLATLLFGARGAIPNFLSIVVGNLFLLSGAALLYFGSQHFLGRKPSVKLWAGLILVALAPLFWFSIIAPHYGLRIGITSALMALMSFAHAGVILRHAPRNFSTYFTATSLLVLALAQTLRFRSAFGLSAEDGIFDNFQPEQTAYITIYAMAILTTTIGTVLMAMDRLRGELEHLATHDSLTGALNRRALIEACELELARCRRNNKVMALLMIDLDHFKVINDTHGHPVGDRVLVDFVTRVKPLLRQPDQLGRFGGEEFVALLPETSLDEAGIVAERLRAAIESNTGDLPPCTVSIGITVSRVGAADLDGMFTQADVALYQAKHAGRNRVERVAQQQQ